ncbi:methyl-accepting chemotaxis protein [Rheinheimera sp. NSM]|uniref:methyl-accepting chemotaxis protein n=1 Tax=Rheinheimera sp. NSM TaxID=3457884 RepID=UPI004036DC44
MQTLSIKQKIMVLATIPVILLTLVLTWQSIRQANAIAQMSVQQLEASLFAERRSQLDAFLELAISATASAGTDEARKQILRQLRYEQGNNYFFVYNTAGVQIVSADNPAREGQNFYQSSTPDGRYLVQDYIKAAQSGGGYVEYSWPRVGSSVASPKLAKAVLLPGTDWVLATGFYIDDLQQQLTALEQQSNNEVKSGIIRLVLIALLLLALIIALGYTLARSILTPLAQAVQAMKDIAQGDGDLTRRLDDQGHELGELANAFNAFAAQVATLVDNVRSSVNSLSQSGEQLSGLMQQAEQGVQRQHSESDQVATAMHEMATTAQDVASSASNAAHAANDADRQVHQAALTLQSAIEVIHGLERLVQTGVDVIGRVGSESQNIGGVVEVIRGIAEQTNLLALNAAIEAARAGEQGRGFAVVADEVRTLAARTATSTQEINNMIGRLQLGAKEAVNAINQIKDGSSHTVSEASKVDKALHEIQNAVSTINDMNNQIASAAEEQTTVSETINQNVHTIVEIAQETADGTGKAASISEQLVMLASGLEQLISRYKTR